MRRLLNSYRYLLLILCLSSALSSLMGQGSTSSIILNDSVMMIGPDVDSLTEEEIYFNPTYLIVDPRKEDLKQLLIRACACDCDTNQPNRRIGVFSVAKEKQVSFSQGNLQYLPAANVWKFASQQYEYLHNSNKYISPSYRNWVDLLDWSGEPGVSFLDWGANPICGDAPGTWRTLSKEEWKYLLHDRPHATDLLLPATIENKLGLVILPDDWVCPEGLQIVTLSQTSVTWDELQSIYTYSNNIFSSNIFLAESWLRMEMLGAVFLPASGYINKDGVLNACGIVACYWSSTPNTHAKGYYMSFGLDPTSTIHSIRTQSAVNVDNGHTVRLVHDTIVPPPAPCETFEVNGVTFNMMCVEGEKYDYLIGQTEVTRALWKAVMGTLPSNYSSTNVPIDNVTWSECEQFIEKLNQLTGQHFRFPVQEEWLYAAKGGQYKEDFLYSGSDDINKVGWYKGNTPGGTQPVATLKPNALGIYDMTGNVWEWVLKTSNNAHLYMGGSYAFESTSCLLSNTMGTAIESNHKGSIGLRLVLDTAEYIHSPEPGHRIGVFSVAKDKQVSFSQGNLQYIQSKDKWQFAPDQLYFTGERHFQNGTLADTIMYFGWSGKNSKAPWGISLSINPTDYEGEFLDWGTNIIGGDTANTWRTTSDEEWKYMLRDRKNADKLHAIARVDTINGLILLPDDWGLPEGMHFEPTIEMVEENQYTLQEWSVMESAGAVFMPMSGYFNHKLDDIRQVNEYGFVRSNNLLDGRQLYSVFKTGKLLFSYQGNNTGNLFYGFPVRLVRDTIIPQYVDLGLSVKWATTNIGATYPEQYGDYFAWGETEPKERFAWDNYKWCDGTKNNITKYNATDGLKTLLPEDDAATANWGSQWRMPTKEELAELRLSCTWEWMTINGVNGNKITGPNGNSIFIPAGGSYNTFDNQLNSVGQHGWIYSSDNSSSDSQAQEMGTTSGGAAQTSCSRCLGLSIRPVCEKDANMVTVTIDPTPANSNVGLHSRYDGFVKVKRSIRVEKGSDVLYQVSNTENGFLSHGDTLHNVMRDTVLKVTLKPFTEGNWEAVDLTGLTRYDNYYISRNRGNFAGPYSNWCYYIMPVTTGETYRVSSHAGQLAALWFVASTLPDYENKIPPTKVSCSKNGGIVGYIAEEFTVPEGGYYLIINASPNKKPVVERLITNDNRVATQ